MNSRADMAIGAASPPDGSNSGPAKTGSDCASWDFPASISTPTILFMLGLLALLTYGLFLRFLPDRWWQNDSTDYVQFYRPVAENLVAGRGLVTSDGSFALRYPPGCTLLLAGLLEVARTTGTHESTILVLFTSLAVLLTALIVYGIAATVFGRTTAVVASVLSITYPFFLWLTKQPNSEIPFVPLFLLALYLFARAVGGPRCNGMFAFAIGVLIGVTSLFRPFTVALSAVLLLVLWASVRKWTMRQRILFSSLILLGNVLTVLPWEVYVWKQTGRWVLLSTNGPISIVDGWTFALKEDEGHRPIALSPDVRRLMLDISEGGQRLQSVAGLGKLFIAKFESTPSAAVSLIALKAERAWYGNDTRSHETLIALLQTPYLLFAVAGAIAAIRSGFSQCRLALLCLLVTLYFWLMATMVLSILRYMVPAMVLLMPLVAHGLVTAAGALQLAQRRNKGSTRRNSTVPISQTP